jgi:hypothetical protein
MTRCKDTPFEPERKIPAVHYVSAGLSDIR